MFKKNLEIQLLILVLVPFIITCSGNSSQQVFVEFSGDDTVDNVIAEIPLKTSLQHTDCAYSVSNNEIKFNYSCDDTDQNGLVDYLYVQIPTLSSAQLELIVQRNSLENRSVDKTQVFLLASIDDQYSLSDKEFEFKTDVLIPDDATEKSGYAHMEGPVWESNKVGYRLYLDKRSRMDIFGKTVEALVLDTVSTDYHQIQDWGADVLKVGTSLGLGAFSAYQDGKYKVIDNWTSRHFKILQNTSHKSSFELIWRDWEVFNKTLTVTMKVEVYADHHYAKQHMVIEGDSEGLLFATGIVKHPQAEIEYEEVVGEGFVLISNGNQSDQGHSLGMSLMVANRYKPKFHSEHKTTNLILMQPSNGTLEYAYAADWNPTGDINYDWFKTYSMDVVGVLSNSINVVVN